MFADFLVSNLEATCETFAPPDSFGIYLRARIDDVAIAVVKDPSDANGMLHIETYNGEFKSILCLGWLAHLETCA